MGLKFQSFTSRRRSPNKGWTWSALFEHRETTGGWNAFQRGSSAQTPWSYRQSALGTTFYDYHYYLWHARCHHLCVALDLSILLVI